MQQDPSASCSNTISHFCTSTHFVAHDSAKSVHHSLTDQFDTTEIALMELKSSCHISTKSMNKILQFCKTTNCENLPTSYDSLEAKLLYSNSIITKATISTKILSIIPLYKWLPELVQLNLLLFLITTPSVSNLVGDMTTGCWFKEFLHQCPPGRIPIAVDIY